MVSTYQGSALAIVQIAGTIVGLLAMAAVPPREGRLMLLPVTPAAAAKLVPLALRDGGRLVGPGPLPLSLIVRGTRSALAWPMLRAGILPLAAPAGGCSAGVGAA